MEHISLIIKRIIKKLRRKVTYSPHITIHSINPYKFNVIDTDGTIIIEDCPILELKNDNICKIRKCPLNDNGKCLSSNPPTSFENIRDTKFNNIIRDKK